MIKTREEFILEYLKYGDALNHQVLRPLDIEDNEEIFQAVIDIGSPRLAYTYSYVVKQCPNSFLRKIACKSAKFAYMYAFFVDRRPRKDTRIASCSGELRYAYYYLRDLDKKITKETRQVLIQNEAWKRTLDRWERFR